MPPEAGCVVVGAGLTGSIAALALARHGHAVELVERRDSAALESDVEVRGLVLSAASMRILEGAGVWRELSGATTPVEAIRVSDSGGFARVELRASELGLPALGWTCPADLMLARFNAACEAHPNIRVHWGTRFVGCSATLAAVAVALDGVDGAQTLRAGLLIGADGAGSAVRDAVGIGVEARDYAQRAVVAQVSAARPVAGTAFEHFTRSGPLALLPVGSARYVSVQCLDAAHADAALALDDAAYCAMLERRFGARLGSFHAPGPRRDHALERRSATALTAPRTVLVGNAANTVHPNGAQGYNLGLRDVAALAALAARNPDPGEPTMLARYADARRGDHRGVVTFTDLLAQGFASRLGAVTCARRAALGLVASLPPVRRRLMLEASGLGALARMPGPS